MHAPSLLLGKLPSQALDLSPFGRSLSRGLEDAHPGLGVLGLDGLLRGLDAQAALLVHGDGRARLQVGALGDEDGCETGVARLQDQIEEWLFRQISG